MKYVRKIIGTIRWGLTLALVVSMTVSLTGCDALQRKFTRKNKAKKPIPRLYQLKKYDIKPSVGLYSKHYAYWQSWMSELIQDLGQNRKRDIRCIDEALSQLYDMRNILIQEKADQLTKHIRRIKEARDTIVKEALSQYNKSQVLMTIEREERTIRRDFDVDRVKNYIRDSFEGMPAAPSRDAFFSTSAAVSADTAKAK